LSERQPHIGLNLVYLVPGETGGMEVYARELLPALLAAAPSFRFTAFVNRETASAGGGPWGELMPAVTVPVNARSRVGWVLGEQTMLPRLAARAGVDLLHSLASTAPAWGRFRRVVTVHDLIYARHPEAHAGVRTLGMRALVPLAVGRSDRVIAPSESTRRDLVELLGLATERIDVVPEGLGTALVAREGNAHNTDEAARERARSAFAIGERRMVLSLSAKRPHKNLAALIRALSRIPSERRPVLVLPGYPTWHEPELRALADSLGVADWVRFLGWLPAEEIEALWSLADVFAYPSLYEGFGLPVLEAMARGVPVVCSNTSSLPEVAGDAALLVDPRDAGAIAAALERVLLDPAEAERLREAGRAQAARFSWAHAAQLTLASYERVLGNAQGHAGDIGSA
jgi:glycosyltransferase involved in cell wall biosynthesis